MTHPLADRVVDKLHEAVGDAISSGATLEALVRGLCEAWETQHEENAADAKREADRVLGKLTGRL